MKHTLALHLFLAVALPAFATTKTVTWSLPANWADAVDYPVVAGYRAVCGGGMMPRTDVGEVAEPDLPYYRIRIALPANATFGGVTSEVEWEAVDLDGALPLPIAQPVPTGSEVVYPSPGAAYRTVYPATVAKAEFLQIMSDVRMMPIVVTPFKWDGSTKTLYRAKSLTVKATFDAPASRRLAFASVASQAADTSFRQMALSMTVNPDDATTASTGLRLAAAAATVASEEANADYVIISPHEFVSLWQTFAAFRKTTENGKSHSFFVKDCNDIYEEFADVNGDDALKIHRYVEKLYALTPRKIKYVVLGAAAKKYKYDNQTMVPARYVVCGGSLSQLLDMYYGCMDRLPDDTGVEVWDYDGDGAYLGHRNANGSYSQDSNAYIDWAQDLAVFRFPLMERVVEAGIELTAGEIMTNFINKVKRVESDAYADRYSAILTGSTGFSTSWRGGAGRVEMYGLITDEREFFDQGTNVFDPAHPSGASDSEYIPRDHNWEFLTSLRGNRKVLMNNSSYSTCSYQDIYKTSGDFLDTVCHGWARGAVGAVNSESSFSATGIYTIYDCAVPCDTGMFDYCPGDSYGISNCICVGEAPILAPNGGALASVNNTRYGWSASWTTSYGLHEKGMAGQHSGRLSWLFMEALSGMASWNSGQGYQPMDAGTALMYAHNQHGTPYASAAWGLSGAQVTGQGDPLARLAVQHSRTWEPSTLSPVSPLSTLFSTNAANWRVAGLNAKQVFDVSRDVSLPLAGKGDQAFDVDGSFSASALYVAQDENATFTLQSTNSSFKVYRETVITNGNVCWKSAGGFGRNGIRFVGSRGDITLPGNAKRYFGEKFLNVGKIDVCGGNVTIDTPRNATFAAALDYDEIAFVATNPADVAEWNILRSRTAGIFKTSSEKHLPVVNSKLILQTCNIGGSGSGNADKPLIFATNSTIKVQANPLWTEECFVRPTYLHDSTLIGDYDKFAFGPNDNKGYDLYVSGQCAIAGDTPIRLNGTLRVHFLGESAALEIANPLCDGEATGSVVFDGAGKVKVSAALTFGGTLTVSTNVTVEAVIANAFAQPVVVEDGGSLTLGAIPLAGLPSLTVNAGGSLHLPAPTYTGTYKIIDATTTKLTVDPAATLYDEKGNAIEGEVTQGHFILAADQLVWQSSGKTWDLDPENTSAWKTESGTAAPYADNSPLKFGNLGAGDTVSVLVGTNVAPGFVNFKNDTERYVFTAAGGWLPTITFNSLIAATPMTFEVPLSVPGGIMATGGSAQFGDVTTPKVEIADGARVRATGAVRIPSQKMKKMRFEFSETRTSGNRAAIRELRLFNEKGFFRLPAGTVIRDIAGQSVEITGSSGTYGHTSKGSSGNESLAALVDDLNEGGNKWWASKSASPTWFEITFPEPVDPVTGYSLATADQEARDPKDWKVYAGFDEDRMSLVATETGIMHNSRRDWMKKSGATPNDRFPVGDMSGLALVRTGGELVLDGTWCDDLDLKAGAVLKVVGTNSLSAYNASNSLYLPSDGTVEIDLSEADSVATAFPILTGFNLTADQFGKFECVTETAMLLLKDGDIYAATANVAVPPYAASVSGDANWSEISFTDKNADTFTWANANVKASGAVTLDVTADTVLTMDAVGTIASITITGSGKLTVNAADGITPLAPAFIDDSAHTGALVWNVPIGSANVMAGADTRINGGAAGTGLLTVDAGKKVTLGSGVTFANCSVDAEGWMRFAGERDEMAVDDLADATYSFEDTSLAGSFERAGLTIKSAAGDYVRLLGTNDNFYGRSLINYDISGGLVEIVPNGESCWFGQTATAGTTDATTFNQSGGIFRCLADGTGIGSGLLLSYTGGTGEDDAFNLTLSGGLFEVPGSFLNFGNPTVFTLKGGARLRAKGFASTMSKGTINLGTGNGDTSSIEIGSLGFQPGAATVTMHPNTYIVGFETGAYLSENVILYGSGRKVLNDVMTVAATNGATLALRDMKFDFYEYQGEVFNGNEPVTFGNAAKGYAGEVILESESSFPKRWRIAAGTVIVGKIRAQVASTLIERPTDGRVVVVLTEEEYVSGAASEILYCGDWANGLSTAELRSFITVRVDRGGGVVDEDTTGTFRCANGVVEFLPAGAAGYLFPISATVTADADWTALDWRDRNGVKYTNDWEGVFSAELVCDTCASVTMDRSISMKRLTTRVSSAGLLELIGGGQGTDRPAEDGEEATLTLTDKLDDSASTGTTRLHITLGEGMTVSAGKALMIDGAKDTATVHGKLIIGANSQVTVTDGYWNGEVEMTDSTATLYYSSADELTQVPNARNATSVGTIAYAAPIAPSDGKAQFGSTSARAVDGTYEFIGGTELGVTDFVTGLGNNTILKMFLSDAAILNVGGYFSLSEDDGSQTSFYIEEATNNAPNVNLILGKKGCATLTIKNRSFCDVGGITTLDQDMKSSVSISESTLRIGKDGINIVSTIHSDNVMSYPIGVWSGTIACSTNAAINVTDGICVMEDMTLAPAAGAVMTVNAPLERYWMSKKYKTAASELRIDGAGRVDLNAASDLAGGTSYKTGYTTLKSGTLRLAKRGLLGTSRVVFGGGKMEVLLTQDEAGQQNDYQLFMTTANAATVTANAKVLVKGTGSEVSGSFSVSGNAVYFKPTTITGITANITEDTDGDWSAAPWKYGDGQDVPASVWGSVIGTATLRNAVQTRLTFSGTCTISTLNINNSGVLELAGGGTMTAAEVSDADSTGTTTIGAFLKPQSLKAGRNTIIVERDDYAVDVPQGAKLTIPGWTTPSKVSGAGVVAIDLGSRDALVGDYWTKDGGVTGTNQIVRGTWELTGDYPNGKEILITGTNAILRLKDKNDITGYSGCVGGVTVEDGGEFRVYKRDTFSRKLVLRNGGKLLMNSDNNDGSGRSFDFFTGSSLVVGGRGTGETGETGEEEDGGEPCVIGGTDAKVDAASGDPIVNSGIVALRNAGFTATVDAGATLNVYARWGGAHSTGNGWTKMGAGTMAFYRSSGQTGAMTVSEGVVRLVNNGQGTAGSIVNDATLEVVTSNGFTKTMGNAISGSGTIVKLGAGTLNFGTMRPTMPIRIAEGKLAFTLTAEEKVKVEGQGQEAGEMEGWIRLFKGVALPSALYPLPSFLLVYDVDGVTAANVVDAKAEDGFVYVKVETYRMPITLANNSTMPTTWTGANWYDANDTLIPSEAWATLSRRTNLAVAIFAYADTTLTVDADLGIATFTIGKADGVTFINGGAAGTGCPPYRFAAGETLLNGTLQIGGGQGTDRPTEDGGGLDLGVVSGSGTLIATNEIPAVRGLTTSAWTGLVKLMNVTTNAIDLGTLANASSRVALENVTTTDGITVPSGIAVEIAISGGQGTDRPTSGPIVFADGAILKLTMATFAQEAAITDGEITADPAKVSLYVNGALRPAGTWSVSGGKILLPLKGPYTATMTGSCTWSALGWKDSSDTPIDVPNEFWAAAKAMDVARLTVSADATLSGLPATSLGLLKIGGQGVLTFAEACGIPLEIDASSVNGYAMASNAVCGAAFSRWLVKGNLTGTVTVTNAPAVPKGYSVKADTVAGLGVRLVVTAPEEAKFGSLNLNFLGNKSSQPAAAESKVSALADLHGAHPVAGTTWFDIESRSHTTTVTVEKVEVEVKVSKVANAYGTGVTDCDRILCGYADDGSGPQVELTGIPFDQYRVILYRATDTADTCFSGVQIGTAAEDAAWYAGPDRNTATGGCTVRTAAQTVWGDSDERTTLAEGVNFVVSDVLSGGTVYVNSPKKDGRGCVAAIQIVKVGRIAHVGTPETFAPYVVGAWDGFENLSSLTNPAGFAYAANLNGAAVNDDGSVTIGTKPLAITGGQWWNNRASGKAIVVAMLVSDYSYELAPSAAMASFWANGKGNDYIGWKTGANGAAKSFAWYNYASERPGNNSVNTPVPGDGGRYWYFVEYNDSGTYVMGTKLGTSAVVSYVTDTACKDHNLPGQAINIGGKDGGVWPATGMKVYAVRICNEKMDNAKRLAFAANNSRYQDLGLARMTAVEMRGTPVLWVKATAEEREAGELTVALPNFNGPLESAVVHAETEDGEELATYGVTCDDEARTVTATISAEGPKHYTGEVKGKSEEGKSERIRFGDIVWSETMTYAACNSATLTVEGDVTLTMDGTEVLKRLDVVGSGTLNLVLESGGQGTADVPAIATYGLGECTGMLRFGFDPGGSVRVVVGEDATVAFAEKPTCALTDNGGWVRYEFAYEGKVQDRYEYAGEGNALTLYGSAQSGVQYRIGGSGTFSGAAVDNELNGGVSVTWAGDYAANGNTYLGMTHGTLTVATGACVRVPHVRILNNGSGDNRATLNVDGTLVVTSTSGSANVWSERGSYRGILFGHWHGQGTYNVNAGGRLLATNAYMQIVYTAEAQALNVKGGHLVVRGIQANEANDGTVTLSDGGVIELAEGYLGQAVIQNYGYGTVRAYSYGNSTTLALVQAMTLTDAANGTTFDPAGLAIEISGNVGGAGKLVVEEEVKVEGQGQAGKSGRVTLSGTRTYAGGTVVRRGILSYVVGTMAGAVTLEKEGVIDLSAAVETNAYAITTGTLTLGEGAGIDNITVNGKALAGVWRLNASGNGIEKAEAISPEDTREIVPAASTNGVKIVATWTNGEEAVKQDITAAFTLTKVEGGVKVELNPNGAVEVGAETIAVRPELAEAGDEQEPLEVGNDVAVGVKTIPGLTYSLMRGSEIGDYPDMAASERASGPRTKLVDDSKPDGRAFYIIRVGR